MNLLALLVGCPVAGALLAFVGSMRGRASAAWTAALSLAVPLWALTVLSFSVHAGNPVEYRRAWIPHLGWEFALRLDGLSLAFCGIVFAVGLLVVLYAHYYMPRTDRLGRFFAILLLFAAAMTGLVLADDLVLVFVFWEGTSLMSFLLVAYHSESKEARLGARLALMVTVAGGLALLAGFLLLGHMSGTHRLSEIVGKGEVVRTHSLYAPALVLILLGVFTKSAQFPFHFWLPAAMAAPTPASAYLHSATMVKAGVFLLARLFPVLSGTSLWFGLVAGAGLATLAVGAYIALFKHDVKELLAYSTVSHLGLITLLLGLGTPLGAVAAVFHVINHATFKASLFMAAGIIDHEAGSRDMRLLNGLWFCMPYTALLATVSAAAMAGVPLLNGFLSKEMFFAELLHQEGSRPLRHGLTFAAALAGLFSVAYSLRFIHDVFFDRPWCELPRRPHEAPAWMKVPVTVLTGVCLVVGLFPDQTVRPFLDAASAAVLMGPPPEYSLALWHGFTPPFLLSACVMAGGVGLYTFREHLFRLHDAYFPAWTGGMLLDRLLESLVSLAGRVVRLLHNGSLRRALAFFLVLAAVLGTVALMATRAVLLGPLPLTPVDAPTAVGAALLVVGTGAAVFFRSRPFWAILNLGVTGIVVTLAFVRFSGPDLALTQIAVEMVFTVLFLLVLFFMPQDIPSGFSRWRRGCHALVALFIGWGVAAVTLGVLTRPYAPVSDYFLRVGKPLAGGANVVNVILVDFRGFDTLGEITVMAIAAVGIFGLLDCLRRHRVVSEFLLESRAKEAHPPLLAQAARLLMPLALMVAVFLFFRGHNRPGGGFVAGLVVATILILQHMANGIEWAQARLRFRILPWIAAGLLLAVFTGLGSLFLGRPFLTSAVVHGRLPLIGHWEITSALAFDLGVFCTVVGTLLLILVGLGRLSVGADRVPHPKESRGEVD
ncbi:monovalent cation/H+ antiporter subunit A [Desulfosoma sp.]